MPGPKPRRLEDLFWARVVRADDAGCWGWVGSRTPFGYGQMRARTHAPHPLLAHRVSWELHHGPIPEGGHVLHHCDNPPCSNPAHLYLGDQRANNADRDRQGRSHFAKTRGLTLGRVS